MEDNGGFGIRSWVFPNQSLKENRILQFISAVAEREKALMPPERDPAVSVAGNSRFVGRNGSVPEFSVAHTAPVEFSREAWLQQRDMQAKFFHPSSGNSNLNAKDFGTTIHEQSGNQMLHIGSSGAGKPEPEQEGGVEGNGKKESEVEKQPKALKTKKARTKVTLVKEEADSPPKGGKKNSGVVLNGITLDLSCIPTPVCSCTGVAQQCYRWGSGGWQSACCTTTLSMYPLPMSQKRRGARIAGRKMSRGAFKKVLEKLLSEGHSLSNPVDLRTYWAKHGTNKFVTIR